MQETPVEVVEPSEPSVVRKQRMDESGEKLGKAIDEVGESLETTPMSWLNQEAWLGIRWLKLITSVALLLALAVGSPLLHAAIDRHLHARARGQPQSASQVILDAIRHPLYLFLWVCGVYWALTPLFRHFAGPGGRNLLRTIAGGLTDVVAIVAGVWFAARLIALINRRLRYWAAAEGNTSARVLAEILRKSLRLILPALGVLMVLPLVYLAPEYLVFVRRAVSLYMIVAVSWVILYSLNAFESLILGRHRMDIADNLRARRIYTQVNVLKKVLVAGVFILAIGSMFMVFESVRRYGTSILASAGIFSLIIGVAAQRSIAGLFAGFQIAIAQPIRIDDVVVVEGEWGRIEEISLTYVVVRIWDQRRLVLPINYFIEKPFQNWTRNNAEVLGAVFLRVDYTAPIDELRTELTRIVNASEHWDGRTVGLQVTDSRDHTLELRALASAANGSRAWDLRCEIREKLIAFLRDRYPESLPRIRTGVDERLDGLLAGAREC